MPHVSNHRAAKRFAKRPFQVTVLAILAAVFCLAAQPSYAQKSWLDKGKNLLDNYTKSSPGGTAGLGTDEIANGLREALKVGTERVVNTLGQADGYNGNTDVHIPLPGTLQKVQSTLRKFGFSALADDVELRLNRAAEAAAPKAKDVFWQAVTDMTMADVQKIYDGPDDAATQYFKDKMSAPLTDAMRPIVDQSLADVGAIQAYDQMMGQYKTVPFVPDVKADLTNYTLGKALDGMFLYLAREEAAIRQNPAKRTTELLQKVFAGK